MAFVSGKITKARRTDEEKDHLHVELGAEHLSSGVLADKNLRNFLRTRETSVPTGLEINRDLLKRRPPQSTTLSDISKSNKVGKGLVGKQRTRKHTRHYSGLDSESSVGLLILRIKAGIELILVVVPPSCRCAAEALGAGDVGLVDTRGIIGCLCGGLGGGEGGGELFDLRAPSREVEPPPPAGFRRRAQRISGSRGVWLMGYEKKSQKNRCAHTPNRHAIGIAAESCPDVLSSPVPHLFGVVQEIDLEQIGNKGLGHRRKSLRGQQSRGVKLSTHQWESSKGMSGDMVASAKAISVTSIYSLPCWFAGRVGLNMSTRIGSSQRNSIVGRWLLEGGSKPHRPGRLRIPDLEVNAGSLFGSIKEAEKVHSDSMRENFRRRRAKHSHFT
ncbi:hypothetical protein FB45DRAFT_998387 [Roridomyces roridus]|uniref:Uncharacterized protein n=1 Tax=Roridomyces roridus TaxID=1738132 RepID=A0AAD7CEV7_9AGAR|nr:hypothetical protein FB45DRAFT_998387 [Roridomyces roridus]